MTCSDGVACSLMPRQRGSGPIIPVNGVKPNDSKEDEIIKDEAIKQVVAWIMKSHVSPVIPDPENSSVSRSNQ